MKTNSQATARIKTYIDYELTEADSHITTFRGMRTGVILTLVLFWFPFIIIYYLFGWMYIVGYGAAISIVFSALGLFTRFYIFLRSLFHSKPSAEAFGS